MHPLLKDKGERIRTAIAKAGVATLTGGGRQLMDIVIQ